MNTYKVYLTNHTDNLLEEHYITVRADNWHIDTFGNLVLCKDGSELEPIMAIRDWQRIEPLI